MYLSGEGYDYAVLKDYADRIQIQLQRVKDVGKVELLGLQDEKIWIELSNLKLATLGLPLAAVQKALEEQNAVSTAGFFETPTERVLLRVSGNFKTVEEIERFPIRVGERTLRISDVADVRRGFNDPAAPRMRFMGSDALGLAVAMKDGGDILALGKALEAEFERALRQSPAPPPTPERIHPHWFSLRPADPTLCSTPFRPASFSGPAQTRPPELYPAPEYRHRLSSPRPGPRRHCPYTACAVPGETQLETDRRLLRVRISQIKSRLKKVRSQREQSRRGRQRADIPTVSLACHFRRAWANRPNTPRWCGTSLKTACSMAR